MISSLGGSDFGDGLACCVCRRHERALDNQLSFETMQDGSCLRPFDLLRTVQSLVGHVRSITHMATCGPGCLRWFVES